MHPLQEDRTTTFPRHTVALRLLQLQLRPRDTETKRRRQQRPRAPIENHSEITDLTLRRHDTTLLHQPQAHRRQLPTGVVTMRRRQPLALETAQDTLIAMRSNIGEALNIAIIDRISQALQRSSCPQLASRHCVSSVVARSRILGKSEWVTIPINEPSQKYY
jgi:hypothetical protein